MWMRWRRTGLREGWEARLIPETLEESLGDDSRDRSLGLPRGWLFPMLDVKNLGILFPLELMDQQELELNPLYSRSDSPRRCSAPLRLSHRVPTDATSRRRQPALTAGRVGFHGKHVCIRLCKVNARAKGGCGHLHSFLRSCTWLSFV